MIITVSIPTCLTSRIIPTLQIPSSKRWQTVSHLPVLLRSLGSVSLILPYCYLASSVLDTDSHCQFMQTHCWERESPFDIDVVLDGRWRCRWKRSLNTRQIFRSKKAEIVITPETTGTELSSFRRGGLQSQSGTLTGNHTPMQVRVDITRDTSSISDKHVVRSNASTFIYDPY